MPPIVGVLPMAGSGSRLGLPFPKPLAPTITEGGLKPLYSHAKARLEQIASRVIVVASPINARFLTGLDAEVLLKQEAGELPTSLALVARTLQPDTIMAVALPDSVWFPATGMQRLLVRYLTEQDPIDGVLGLFEGDETVLDEVLADRAGMVRSVVAHATCNTVAEHFKTGITVVPLLRRGGPRCYPTGDNGKTVVGWGCFIATAGCLRGLTDDRPLGPQLADYSFSSVRLDGPYLDLGTPDRYIAYHDLRQWQPSPT